MCCFLPSCKFSIVTKNPKVAEDWVFPLPEEWEELVKYVQSSILNMDEHLIQPAYRA